MRRRLDLVGALVARPAVVVLDEPTTGLDPRGRADTWQAVRDLVAEGTTVLLTTQYLEEADQLADAIVVIEGGTVVACGSATELKSRVGGDRLSLNVPEPRHRVSAAEILAALGTHSPASTRVPGASPSRPITAPRVWSTRWAACGWPESWSATWNWHHRRSTTCSSP